MTSFKKHALALAAQGFRVFPLRHGTKKPALSDNWQKIATSDAKSVDALWTDSTTGKEQPFNIGIALDDDVVVIDVDVRDGRRGRESLALLEAIYDPLPATYRVRTASKGDHHYFRVPKRMTFGKTLAEHVDIKCAGGYVVGPGSIIDGKRYSVVSGSPDALADLPADWLEHARKSAKAASPSRGEVLVDEDTPDAVARATEWLRKSAPSHGTFAVAAKVKDFGVSEPTALELLMTEWVEPRELGKDLEHVAFRVRNAYLYGQNPVGIASASVEFDAVEVVDRRTTTKAKRPKLYYERYKDAHASTGAPYLIKGWYDSGAMVVTYGESNSGKTNVVLSQAFAIAAGEPWAGAKVRQGLVVYVAAEGGAGVRKRIAAHHKKHGLRDLPFALVPCSIDLLRPAGDTKALIELIKAAEAEFGQPCVMVVLDTLSRVLAGGNENAPDDMGALVIHCDRIREATAATVHIIHHSGKNLAAGARGHSSLRAATDTEIEIAGQMIAGKKQRDMERLQALAFTYETVELGRDIDGDPITSIITHVAKVNEFENKLSVEQVHMLDVLRRLVLADLGIDPATFDGAISPKMTEVKIASRKWRAALAYRDKSKGAANKAFERDTDALIENRDIDVVAVNGTDSLWNLLPRQTATNRDMS